MELRFRMEAIPTSTFHDADSLGELHRFDIKVSKDQSFLLKRGMLSSLPQSVNIKVSRTHFEIKINETNDGFVFVDMSSNGTWIKRGEERQNLFKKGESLDLLDGDEIWVVWTENSIELGWIFKTIDNNITLNQSLPSPQPKISSQSLENGDSSDLISASPQPLPSLFSSQEIRRITAAPSPEIRKINRQKTMESIGLPFSSPNSLSQSNGSQNEEEDEEEKRGEDQDSDLLSEIMDRDKKKGEIFGVKKDNSPLIFGSVRPEKRKKMEDEKLEKKRLKKEEKKRLKEELQRKQNLEIEEETRKLHELIRSKEEEEKRRRKQEEEEKRRRRHEEDEAERKREMDRKKEIFKQKQNHHNTESELIESKKKAVEQRERMEREKERERNDQIEQELKKWENSKQKARSSFFSAKSEELKKNFDEDAMKWREFEEKSKEEARRRREDEKRQEEDRRWRRQEEKRREEEIVRRKEEQLREKQEEERRDAEERKNELRKYEVQKSKPKEVEKVVEQSSDMEIEEANYSPPRETEVQPRVEKRRKEIIPWGIRKREIKKSSENIFKGNRVGFLGYNGEPRSDPKKSKLIEICYSKGMIYVEGTDFTPSDIDVVIISRLYHLNPLKYNGHFLRLRMDDSVRFVGSSRFLENCLQKKAITFEGEEVLPLNTCGEIIVAEDLWTEPSLFEKLSHLITRDRNKLKAKYTWGVFVASKFEKEVYVYANCRVPELNRLSATLINFIDDKFINPLTPVKQEEFHEVIRNGANELIVHALYHQYYESKRKRHFIILTKDKNLLEECKTYQLPGMNWDELQRFFDKRSL
eukprot:TRINITY_DN2119_c0_g2_i2.p1 TRINITY_DN2119_c0_g2~~TRINITY_DN2119_c0_g2_i2.p1  ORF type:complete len:832 (-),score=334.16 TRINITY_DN2119_c0_g2_i2:8-2446(-)